MKWIIVIALLGIFLSAIGEHAEREYKKHCIWHVVPQGNYDCGE